MSKMRQVKGKEAVRAFKRAGFSVIRITGSHHIMEKEGHVGQLSVPVHRGENVGKGLLLSLIATAGLTWDEFLEYL